MTTETDRDQWKAISALKDDLHQHAVECSERYGRTEERLSAIERAIERMGNRLWLVLAAALSGAGIYAWQAFGG